MQVAPARAAPRASPARAALQAKLEVGPAGDHFEREADSVAAAVMRGSAPAAIPPTITPISGVQRKPAAAPRREEEKPRAAAVKSAAQRKASPAAPPKREEEKPRPAVARAPVQRKAASPADELKKAPARPAKAQREAASGTAGGAASAETDAAIQAMRAGPAPKLDGPTRGFMEGRFGRDFGDVRVHHDSRAAAAAQAIGARAFTTGNDIFFNSGEYRPETSSGRQLLAHELTHTVQQGGSGATAARVRIQRAGGSGTAASTKEPIPANRELEFTLNNGGPNRTGRLKLASPQEIVFPYLNLPTVNNTLKGTSADAATAGGGALPTLNTPYSVRGRTPRGGSATATWLDGARASTFQTQIVGALTQKLPPGNSAPTTPPVNQAFQMPNGAYVLGFDNPTGDERTTFIWGRMPELARTEILLNPRWSPIASNEMTMDVDHILELQLGGADRFNNMWLLESRFNQQSGALISGRITSELTQALRSVQDRYDTSSISLPEATTIRNGWTMTFMAPRAGPDMPTSPGHFWTRDAIRTGEQLRRLKFLTSQDLSTRGFRPRTSEGTPSRIYVFPTEGGGLMRYLDVGQNRQLVSGTPTLFPNMELRSGRLPPEGEAGERIAILRVMWQKVRRTPAGSAIRRGGIVQREDVEKEVDLVRLPGFLDVGYVNPSAVYASRTGWDVIGSSPVDFGTFGLDSRGYLLGEGTLTATKALLPGLRADIRMLPTELSMDFPIPQESFSLGPVTVTDLAMSLGINSDGPFIRGTAAFVVSSLGQGSITAEVSREGPIISGEFNLAMDFLNPAHVAVSYNFADDTFHAEATLGVERGRIPGIDSGQVTVVMTREAVSVTGSLNLGGPLRGTVINVGYNPTDGLRIGADNIPLPLSNIPAIQNATLSISASKPPDGGWSFAGRGQATLAVPGATGTIGIDYLDGAVTFTANAQVARGPATGTLNFTATNRPMDEEGRPIEGPPTDAINVWGRGSVSVRFGNLLTGTAGIELTRDNRVIISGAIGLPPVFQVFARRDYNRDLFRLSPPEFPIWGVSVAGIGVGIFAFVDARVAFNAYVGPGEIRNAQIGATLDLDRPEDATVTGHGEFHVPAYAGLTLDVGGGLRARAAVAYAEGRVGLAGSLGVQAGASAAVDINWSREAGLALSADLRAEARPKFELSANASVTVGVNLLVTNVSHTFGPWRRVLGSFGPDMTLGVRMPVRWSEANGLDLSLDNIEVTRPSLDASALMRSVFDQLAG